MSERDFLKTLSAYTQIQRLLGVIEGASCGIKDEGIASIVGDSAVEIGKILDDVFSLVQVVEDDDEA